jgi:hypothetical protein
MLVLIELEAVDALRIRELLVRVVRLLAVPRTCVLFSG